MSITISEFEFTNDAGEAVGKGAVLRCIPAINNDPTYEELMALDEAVNKYVGDKNHTIFIDANMVDPCTRVVVSNIDQSEFKDFSFLIKYINRRNVCDEFNDEL